MSEQRTGVSCNAVERQGVCWRAHGTEHRWQSPGPDSPCAGGHSLRPQWLASMPEWSYGLVHRTSGPGVGIASQTDNRAVGWMMRALPLWVGGVRRLTARADWRKERSGQTLTSRNSKRRWQVRPWCRRARHWNVACGMEVSG